MMKVEIEVSEKNEITRAPFWLIIDPRQNFKTNDDGVSNIAFMVTGLFFSREEAQRYLDAKHYHFSKNARVWCHSAVEWSQYGEKVKF
jgi:hypothetical protein